MTIRQYSKSSQDKQPTEINPCTLADLFSFLQAVDGVPAWIIGDVIAGMRLQVKIMWLQCRLLECHIL